MQPQLKSKVRCTDREIGEVTKVIVDPFSREISHIVVSMNGSGERQVSMALVQAVTDGGVQLRNASSEVAALPPFKREEYLSTHDVEIARARELGGALRPHALEELHRRLEALVTHPGGARAWRRRRGRSVPRGFGREVSHGTATRRPAFPRPVAAPPRVTPPPHPGPTDGTPQPAGHAARPRPSGQRPASHRHCDRAVWFSQGLPRAGKRSKGILGQRRRRPSPNRRIRI